MLEKPPGSGTAVGELKKGNGKDLKVNRNYLCNLKRSGSNTDSMRGFPAEEDGKISGF